MDLKDVLINNYIPYAKGVIISRATPNIDGLKPVLRRILYTMHINKVYKQNKKSHSIIGDVMKLHPNGDSSIYDALIRVTTGHNALNEPYIISKGNFGKFYSKNIAPAASRYTEARLSDISELLFDGINENAVDMVPNYDSTYEEPKLLPVKFPSILVNNTEGIAVALSSTIPTFSLTDVCKATIGVLDGSITTDYQLAVALNHLEFPTGGSTHIGDADFFELIQTGKGSVTMTGTADIYNNKIVITEVPYGVKIEDIINEVNNNQDIFKDVSKAINLTGKNGMRAEILLKRGTNSNSVYKKLLRHTKFRNITNFNTTVIVDNQCKEGIGIFELLNYWIEFRLNTIQRIHEYRLNKEKANEEALIVWEKIQDSLSDVAHTLINSTEEEATQVFRERYSLSDTQVKVLLDMRTRDLTIDRLQKKLKVLDETRQKIIELQEIVTNPSKCKEISIKELKAIITKFGKESKTQLKEQLILEKDEPEKISDEIVKVILTKNFNIKRIMNTELNIKTSESDPIVKEMMCHNNESLLVFTSNGNCYKIPVNDIDCSRTIPNTYIYSMINPIDDSPIVYVTTTDSEYFKFNVLYANGKLEEVYIDRFTSNRKIYKKAFTGDSNPDKIQIIIDNEFFVITNLRRTMLIEQVNKIAYNKLIIKKTGSLKIGEEVIGALPVRKVPNIQNIDLYRYRKSYFVAIKDKLW